MRSELKGSPVKVYKLHREAAPLGGLIAMAGTTPVATCVKDGEQWTIRAEKEVVATFEGNTTSAVIALHMYLMGFDNGYRLGFGNWPREGDPAAKAAIEDMIAQSRKV